MNEKTIMWLSPVFWLVLIVTGLTLPAEYPIAWMALAWMSLEPLEEPAAHGSGNIIYMGAIVSTCLAVGLITSGVCLAGARSALEHSVSEVYVAAAYFGLGSLAATHPTIKIMNRIDKFFEGNAIKVVAVVVVALFFAFCRYEALPELAKFGEDIAFGVELAAVAMLLVIVTLKKVRKPSAAVEGDA